MEDVKGGTAEDHNAWIESVRQASVAFLRCHPCTYMGMGESIQRAREAVSDVGYAASVASHILERMRSGLPSLRRFSRKVWSVQIQSMRDELAKLRKERGRSARRCRNRLRREILAAQQARRRAMCGK